ncbi:MAG: DUF6431 domain-containing protein [Clostridiales bacterium]|jgi:hypothetical protein|nr:DUF6431 domain-containing protein [Clostridiales bacterium]
MSISAYLGTTADEYRKKSHSMLLALRLCCPDHADQIMVLHDKYKRKIKDISEEIIIHRLICHKCGKTIAVLPDFLLPYKQFSAGEIEAVLIDSEEMSVYDIETEASVYTIRRWMRSIRLTSTEDGQQANVLSPIIKELGQAL